MHFFIFEIKTKGQLKLFLDNLPQHNYIMTCRNILMISYFVKISKLNSGEQKLNIYF